MNLKRQTVYLKTFSGVAEELVQRGRLALVDGELVQNPVGGERGRRRFGGVQTAFGQKILRVEHFRHGDAVAEAFVERRQN